ncbi:polysaccharide deactylase family protein, PEP-CTERM locus subfamily [Alicycliphilus sp. B1]|nr:polysaccharide deactylase family protein, PEP-CTERM locus subfamily [Alicycliphilus sp. B1]
MHDPGPITNALTIDVEDYFQVSAFAPYIKRSEWDSRGMPCGAQCGSYNWPCWTIEASARPSSRWAGSPNGTLQWCAASWMAGMSLPAMGMGMSVQVDLSETDFFNDVHRAKALLGRYRWHVGLGVPCS